MFSKILVRRKRIYIRTFKIPTFVLKEYKQNRENSNAHTHSHKDALGGSQMVAAEIINICLLIIYTIIRWSWQPYDSWSLTFEVWCIIFWKIEIIHEKSKFYRVKTNLVICNNHYCKTSRLVKMKMKYVFGFKIYITSFFILILLFGHMLTIHVGKHIRMPGIRPRVAPISKENGGK